MIRWLNVVRGSCLHSPSPFAVALVFLALFGLPGAAQQQPPPRTPPAVLPQQEKPKTGREAVLEKLRQMEAKARRDSLRAAGDTAALALDTMATRTEQQSRQNATPVANLPLDSMMQALTRLPGFSSTQYKGQAAKFNADSGVLVLRARADDKAVVVKDGQTMTADSLLTFNQNTSVACAFGKPVLSGQGADAPVESQRICYNTEQKIGTAYEASTTVSEGASWRVQAKELYTVGKDVYGHTGVFTDCSLEIPHYHFSAGSIKVVNKDVMVARDVTLNFADVPVFWLPFMMQSLKQGRRSGILMPRFSVNDVVRRNSRYNRRIEDIGLYWAISENLGAEVAMDWFANNYAGLRGSFDYRFLDKWLDGRVTYRQFWKTEGGREMTLSTGNSWQPDERTNLRVDANYATSSSFISQRSFDPRELNRSIDSNAGLSRRFDWGSVSMQASRKQYLSDNKVDLTLPSVGVNLSSITLFPATGEGRFFNNATWTGSAQARMSSTAVEESPARPTQRDRRDLTANASHSLTMGKLSLSQGFDLRDATEQARPAFGDSVPELIRAAEQRMTWNTSLNYQQRLFEGTTITPGVRMTGDLAKTPKSANELVASPMRVDVNASLQTNIYGFWPGIGSIERIRHRVSPSFSYSYSPKIKQNAEQDSVFGITQSQEQNRISIGFSQTIEGKVRDTNKSEGQDTLAAVDTAASLDPDKPRRLPQAKPMTLLSLQTDAVVYDFVAARGGGEGIQTTQISNSINSDLLRGLQLSITHDLFRSLGTGGPLVGAEREFSPHLSRVNASFSLNDDSWIFRALGLTRSNKGAPPATGTTTSPVAQPPQAGPVIDRSKDELGLIGTRRNMSTQSQRGPVGGWSASLNYTLVRPRSDDGTLVSQADNQMLTANVTFQPTINWSVAWNTGYSFSTSTFTDHILTLTRQMHDWDANFDFVKAQNGNFSFQFRVALRANPDLKFDYEQRDNTRRQ